MIPVVLSITYMRRWIVYISSANLISEREFDMFWSKNELSRSPRIQDIFERGANIKRSSPLYSLVVIIWFQHIESKDRALNHTIKVGEFNKASSEVDIDFGLPLPESMKICFAEMGMTRSCQ